MEPILALLQVAAAVIVHARAESNLKQWLQRWLAFMPAVGKLHQERGHQQLGHLFVVMRDWEPEGTELALWEAKAAAEAELWRMEPMPPGAGSSEEEQRNVIRHQVKRAFASASAHFIPPMHRSSDIASASAQSSTSQRSGRRRQGKLDEAKTVAILPEFTSALDGFARNLY